MSRHWHLTVSDTQLNCKASTVQHRQCGVTDCGLQGVIKTRGAHLGLAVLGRHVADAHALRGVTPQELHCGQTAVTRTNADQSHLNKHGQLTSVNSSSHQRGAEHLVGGRSGRGRERARHAAKVVTRARRAAWPVSCKTLIAAPRGCG